MNHTYIQNKDTETLKGLLGNKYSQSFDNIHIAMFYLRNIDLKEFLGINSDYFDDIFNPDDYINASIFYDNINHVYLYKRFSENCRVLDIIEIVKKLANFETNYESTMFLLDITNSSINNNPLTEQRSNMLNFVNGIVDGSLEEMYPFTYKCLKRYKKDISKIFELFYDYVDYDNTGRLNYIHYLSFDKMEELFGDINKSKLFIIITYLTTVDIITKSNNTEDMPIYIYNNVIINQENNIEYTRCSSVYFSNNLTTNHLNTVEELSKLLFEHNIFISKINYTTLYQALGKDFADKVFPQEQKNLLENDTKIYKTGLSKILIRNYRFSKDEIQKHLDLQGYALEEEVVKRIGIRSRTNKKTVKTHLYKTLPMILNELDLKRVRMTKEIYEELNVQGKYTNKIILIPNSYFEN